MIPIIRLLYILEVYSVMEPPENIIYMKIIEKVEIHRFRSIADSSIQTEDINIFSGKNNSGKSNVLKALNLFFNGDSGFDQKYSFDKDYNKAFTGHAGGKRSTHIVIHFCKQGDAALSSPFSVTRIFQHGSEAETIYKSTNSDVQKRLEAEDGNVTRQFKIFLNKIEYHYIPAVRDRSFVKKLFLNFEKLIEHDSGKDFAEKMVELSEILNIKSKEISGDFEKFIGLPTRAALSSKASDLLGTVEINVKTGITIVRRTKKDGNINENIEVDLFSSGDGILMSYLAYFLAHICRRISNKMFIWGFEEPENSLEYSKVQKIAEDFYDDFSTHAQIFITTHSPAFIHLKDKDGVIFYRVYLEHDDPKQASKIRTIQEITNRQQSLFESGKITDSEYANLSEELNLVEFAKEIEESVARLNEQKVLSHKVQIDFENRTKELLKHKPANIFICEDSSLKTINLWKKWLGMYFIENVAVMDSGGCTTKYVEYWVKIQNKIDSTYKPKIFRQVDRDCYTSEQVAYLENNSKGLSNIQYCLIYLPVSDIENFAIINNPKFDKRFFEQNKIVILEKFESKAVRNAKVNAKNYSSDIKSPFYDKDETYVKIMQNMRTEALKNWKLYLGGKQMCSLLVNFDADAYLDTLTKKQIPRELADYLLSIKKFYEEQT